MSISKCYLQMFRRETKHFDVWKKIELQNFDITRLVHFIFVYFHMKIVEHALNTNMNMYFFYKFICIFLYFLETHRSGLYSEIE